MGQSPIIFRTLSGDREKCLEAGMDDYLSKPIALDRLVRTLEHWLEVAAADRNGMAAPPVAPTMSVNEAVFRSAEFLALMDNDQTLAATLVQLFVTNMPGDIDKLKAAVASGEGSQIHTAAHFIKGAAANLFAPGINAIAFEIEHAGIDGQLARAKALMPALESSWTDETSSDVLSGGPSLLALRVHFIERNDSVQTTALSGHDSAIIYKLASMPDKSSNPD